MPTTDSYRDPSFLHIIRDLRDDATALFRQEVALAKREFALKAKAYAKNAALLGAAALIGLYAALFVFLFLNNLLQAGLVAAGFSATVALWFAPLLMAMCLGVLALIAALKSLRAMRPENALPRQTQESLREGKDWLKGKVTA